MNFGDDCDLRLRSVVTTDNIMEDMGTSTYNNVAYDDPYHGMNRKERRKQRAIERKYHVHRSRRIDSK